MGKITEILVIIALVVVLAIVGRSKLAVYYYNKGDDYYSRKMYSEAEDFFKKSLQINASQAIVHCGLAKTYMKSGKGEKAREEVEKAKQIDPGNLEAYFESGKIYFAAKKYLEAMEELKKAAAIAPDDGQINQELNVVSSSYAGDCLNKGTEAYLSGDKKKAYDLLNEAIKIKPDLVLGYYTLGSFYYHDHHYKEAEIKLNDALRLDARCWQADKLLGNIYYERGQYQKAFDKFASALSINPSDASINNDLGLALMRMERYSEAIPYLQDALKLKPDDADIQYSLASVSRDKGEFSEAEAAYKKLIAGHPDYPNVHNDLADIYAKDGKSQEARDEYLREIDNCQRKIAKNPQDMVSFNGLAYAYNGIGETDKARAAIKEAFSIEPDYMQAHLTLAKINERSGNYKEVEDSLNKAGQLSGSPSFVNREIDRLKKETTEAAKANKRTMVLSSDKVYLNNGRKISGVIKKETDAEVILEIKAGDSYGTITIKRDTISRIERNKNKND